MGIQICGKIMQADANSILFFYHGKKYGNGPNVIKVNIRETSRALGKYLIRYVILNQKRMTTPIKSFFVTMAERQQQCKKDGWMNSNYLDFNKNV